MPVLKQITKPDVKPSVKPSPKIKPSAQTKPEVKVLLKLLTSPKTKPEVKIEPKVKVPPKIITPVPVKPDSGRIIPPIISGGKGEKKAVKFPDGTVGWRQGEVGKGKDRKGLYYVIPPPYSQVYRVVSKATPENVTVASGKASAYRSLTLSKGKLPVDLDVDVGAQDAHIVGRRNRAAIRFKPDRRRKTKHRLTVKGAPTLGGVR